MSSATLRAFRCFAPVLLVASVACEPEVGRECGSDDFVLTRVTVENGKNDLVQDLGFESCGQGLCASVNGSRPFCTRRCESDLDCPVAEGFVCRGAASPDERLINFGRLACEDWSQETDCATGENGALSETPKLYCAPLQDDAKCVIKKRDCGWGRAIGDEACTTLENSTWVPGGSEELQQCPLTEAEGAEGEGEGEGEGE